MEVHTACPQTGRRERSLLCFFYAALFVAVYTAFMLSSYMAAFAQTRLEHSRECIAVEDSYLVLLKKEKREKGVKVSYTYTSSNEAVATVSKKGFYKGKKAGTADILVREIVDGKATDVGTFTVVVKQSCLQQKNEQQVHGYLTNQPGYYLFDDHEPDESPYSLLDGAFIKYQNSKAKYQFFSCNEKKLRLDEDGTVREVHGTGTVSVDVKELYHKKIRTVGRLVLGIISPKPPETGKIMEVVAGETIYAGEYNGDAWRYHKIEEFILQLSKSENPDKEAANQPEATYTNEDGETFIVPFSRYQKVEHAGVYYAHIFMYDYTKQKYTKCIGTYQVNARQVQTAFTRVASYYPPDRYNVSEGLQIRAGNSMEIPFYMQSDYDGECEVSSSDESVASVMANTAYERAGAVKAGRLYVTASRPGISVITLKTQESELSFKVTVAPAVFQTGGAYQVMAYLASNVPDMGADQGLTFTSSNPEVASMEAAWILGLDFLDSGQKDACFTVHTKDVPGQATLAALYQGEVVYQVTLEVR